MSFIDYSNGNDCTKCKYSFIDAQFGLSCKRCDEYLKCNYEESEGE